PTPLFRRIAASMLTIDPKARSSMWDDLTQRRPTEIDALQGVIIEMGKKHRVKTPLNQRMHDLIKAAETARGGPPGIEPGDVRHAA
ncbi:MAG: ketopantoate reductase C-terminal domain-containing protein, partial [Pseudomonadota bacterium]